MNNPNPDNNLSSFDNVVVLMLENRSFDNLLGYLYEDGVPDGKSYEGLQGKTFKIPVPEYAKDVKDHPFIEPFEAESYHAPFPDPGEVYQHVNTQIYNFISEGNKGRKASDMQKPYNIPDFIPIEPPMDGFIKDYINTLNALDGKEGVNYNNPGFDFYKAIMEVYKPNQVGVLSALAKDFAVFDHWFCSVPSQTYCNRAFWHAGTSGGRVINPPDAGNISQILEAAAIWLAEVWTKPTIFDRMGKKISHAVYKEELISLTKIINGPLDDQQTRSEGNNLEGFKQDLIDGTLPQYSFIEPRFIEQHNDMHPSSVDSKLFGKPRVGSVLLGERLIWEVYTAIKESEYRDKTLFIITFDEHGGCFDHVPPPSAIPPKKGMKGEKDFTFDRLGIRVPMVMVSSFIAEGTIINDVHDHTSFIKSMCVKYHLDGLTDRDKNAKPFGKVFSGPKRKWPEIPAPLIPAEQMEFDYTNDALNDLQKSILWMANYIASKKKGTLSADFEQVDTSQINTVGEALSHLESIKEYL